MHKGEELTLKALKKELSRLERLADKAKAECDECINIGTELIDIHKEFAAIVKSKECNKATIKKLDDLKIRSKKAEKIRKKDLLKLMDKENDTRINVSYLQAEINRLEFRISMRK